VPLFNGDRPAQVADIAVSPSFPDSVVISRSTVGFSGAGNLQVFTRNGTTLTSTFALGGPGLIRFLNDTTLFGFNLSTTEFGGTLFDFDGQTLTLEFTESSLISTFNTEVETGSDGRIYFTNGLVLGSSDLNADGTFNIGISSITSVVEPVPELGLTYFAGPTSFQTPTVILSVFDNETFLLMDSVPLPGVTTDDSEGELIIAGENRLALIAIDPSSDADDPNVLTFISNIPVALPTTVLGDVNQDGVVDFSDIPAFIEILMAGSFLAEADLNQDGAVTFADIPAFIEILVAA